LNTIPGLEATVIEDASASGGGALPAIPIPTRCVGVTHDSIRAKDLSYKLRTVPHMPVLVRISDERVIVDPRTLLDGEIEDIKRAFQVVMEATTEDR
jgi:L-seryl-tRNA(Ser) seleniumtransferase